MLIRGKRSREFKTLGVGGLSVDYRVALREIAASGREGGDLTFWWIYNDRVFLEQTGMSVSLRG
jgi:hypothetical protein